MTVAPDLRDSGAAAIMAASMTRLRSIAACLAVLALLLVLPAGPALAYDQPIIDKAEQAAGNYSSGLATIDTDLQSAALTDAKLTGYRSQIEDIRSAALALSANLLQPIADLNAQIKLLPPLPAANAPPEAPAVAEQRDKLNAQIAKVQGIKSQLDLAAGTADQLASRASAQQRNLFLTRVFESGRSVLNPVLWRDTGLGFGLLYTRLVDMYGAWWNVVRGTANYTLLTLIPAVLLLVAGLTLLLQRRLKAWSASLSISNRVPSDFERVWRVVRALLVIGALLALLVFPVYAVLRAGEFTTPRFDMVYWGVADLLASTSVYWLLAIRLAAPGQAMWRIIDLDDKAAARLPPLVAALAFVSAFTSSIGTIADTLYLPVTYTIGQSALSALIMLLLLALILITATNQDGFGNRLPGRSLYFVWAGMLAPVMWLLIAAGMAALLFGYVALASYLAQQITDTVFIGVVLLLLHHLTDLAIAASFDTQSAFGRLHRRVSVLGERGIERLVIFARILVDVVLVLVGLPIMFLQWAVTWVDFRSLGNSAIQGFKLGTITISPWLIAIVALTLIAGIALTNLMVRWLDSRVLGETRLDKGVQDSLRKGVSYAGYILAAGLALSAAGLDFSTLTIVFGALGVGIGFGLQSIVNNFVSGLILLAERPIRVGDWVVLDGGEGLVKRINVRSTEIETFDNCSVIVPNSSLITGVVKNWTHGDTMGKFTVAVSVAYGSNAEVVHELLLEAARSHPKVLTFPEPLVFLQRFGPYGLDFEIKAAVADIFLGAFVANDLRQTILKVFAEKAITIAQPLGLIQPLKMQ